MRKGQGVAIFCGIVSFCLPTYVLSVWGVGSVPRQLWSGPRVLCNQHSLFLLGLILKVLRVPSTKPDVDHTEQIHC